MPPDWDVAWSSLLEDAARAPAARAPATLGETWDAEWQRTRLDTMLGTSQIVGEAYNDFQQRTEAAIGRPAHEALRERQQYLGAAVTLDDKARMVAGLIDDAPEDAREDLRKRADFRARAADRAQKIERDAGDVYGATYGLSGVATSFAAGVARQAIEPFNVATLPIGGPLKGPVLKVLGREFAIGAGIQAAQEPFIQVNREALGLEAGLGKGAADVLQAGIGQAGMAGLFRAGAAGLRAIRASRAAGAPAPELRAPEAAPAAERTVESPGEPGTPEVAISTGEKRTNLQVPPDPRVDTTLATIRDVLSDRDLAAASRLAERDQVVEALAPIDTPEGRAAHVQAVDQAAIAIDNNKPAVTPRAPETIRRDDLFAPGDTVDVGKNADAVVARVEAALNAGATVTYHIEGKPIAIVAVDRGMMADAQGQRWGIMNLLQPTPGKRTELEISYGEKSSTRQVGETPLEGAVAGDRALEQPPREENLSNVPLPAPTRPLSPPAPEAPAAVVPAAAAASPAAASPPKRKPEGRPLSVLERLAQAGGLRPSGELRSIFDTGGRFVPGFGPLIRKTGMDVDKAWELLVTEGYILDPGLKRGGAAETDFRHALELIEREANGPKIFAEGVEPPTSKAEAKRQAGDRLDAIQREAEAQFADAEVDPAGVDKRLWKRTLELMDKEGETDAIRAYERAILEDEERYEKLAAKRRVVVDDVPGWDIPDTAAAPGGGGAAAPGRPELDRRGVDQGGGLGDATRAAGAGDREPASEATPAGEQRLIPGVEPITEKQRLEAQAGKPLEGGNAAPPEGGLFDENARAQTDLLDLAGANPTLKADADRVLEEAGGDFELTREDGSKVSAKQAIAEAEEDAAAAAELKDCIGGEPENEIPF